MHVIYSPKIVFDLTSYLISPSYLRFDKFSSETVIFMLHFILQVYELFIFYARINKDDD